ncbi:hypothetical protein DFH29DRAFT_997824 [Suillus ampliporus]|nr:hypothetical protein DFH29DRAFT_997824 [Suillus ampliporus]
MTARLIWPKLRYEQDLYQPGTPILKKIAHQHLRPPCITSSPSAEAYFPPSRDPLMAHYSSRNCLGPWTHRYGTGWNDSVFLRDSVDELGKTNNAAHPALKAAAIAFFYTGSYHIAQRRPDILFYTNDALTPNL